MTTRFYIAGPYCARDRIRELAEDLQRVTGWTPTASWLNEPYEVNEGTTGAATDLSDEVIHQHAVEDLWDVSRADVFILLTQKFLGVEGMAGASGGRHIETGFALAELIPVVVVGEPENIFHRLLFVTRVPTWDAEAIKAVFALSEA